MQDQKDLVNYFIDQTNGRFLRLETKIDEILQFKWQIIGGSVVVSTFCSVLFSILYLYIKQ